MPFVECRRRKAIVITYIESFVKIPILYVRIKDADCHFQAECEIHWWKYIV